MKRLNRSAVALMVVLLLGRLAHAQGFSVISDFSDGTSVGAGPAAAVIEDSARNLYGTTYTGGDLNCSAGAGYGCGVVFKFSPTGKETVLHAFTGPPSDGYDPNAAVIRDSAGNLYGTTAEGGSAGGGTVFKVSPTGKETVLYNFKGTTDGCYSQQGLVMDKSGNLYGTTAGCGASHRGTVFKLTKRGKLIVLHSFTGTATDGSTPQNGNLLRVNGNLYGVAQYGGTSNDGVLYEVTAKGTFAVLYSFAGGKTDGCYPFGTPAMDTAGNFYGTTHQCGTLNIGTVWKVSKGGDETILHNFAGSPSDGAYPLSGVALDPAGNVYGTTWSGGSDNSDPGQPLGYGAVYELSQNGTLTLLHSFMYSDGWEPNELLRDPKGVLYGTTASGGDWGTLWEYVF